MSPDINNLIIEPTIVNDSQGEKFEANNETNNSKRTDPAQYPGHYRLSNHFLTDPVGHCQPMTTNLLPLPGDHRHLQNAAKPQIETMLDQGDL